MKKIILFILTLSLIVGAIPFSLATYAVASGTCGENLTWTLDGGTLTISGTGEMKNYYKSSPRPWEKDMTFIETVIIESGVTSIGDGAFERGINITSIVIPDTVVKIGEAAFATCGSLTSMAIGKNVESIGFQAFAACKSFTEINVDKNNTYFSSDNGVLFNKSKTELIQYPIGSERTSYTIPDGVISIESQCL